MVLPELRSFLFAVPVFLFECCGVFSGDSNRLKVCYHSVSLAVGSVCVGVDVIKDYYWLLVRKLFFDLPL